MVAFPCKKVSSVQTCSSLSICGVPYVRVTTRMRHFVHYHNSHRMGYSASGLGTPRVVTDKSVRYLPGGIVWLVSGEGSRSPKSFFLGAAFKVNRIAAGSYEHPKFKNSAHGIGEIFGETLLLSGLGWFETFRSEQSNFRNSLTEITASPVVAEFQALSGYGL